MANFFVLSVFQNFEVDFCIFYYRYDIALIVTPLLKVKFDRLLQNYI